MADDALRGDRIVSLTKSGSPSLHLSLLATNSNSNPTQLVARPPWPMTTPASSPVLSMLRPMSRKPIPHVRPSIRDPSRRVAPYSP